MDKIILVVYLNYSHLTQYQFDKKLIDLKQMLGYNSVDIVTYIIPVNDSPTRVECVNPKLVSGEEYQKAKIVLDDIEQKLKTLSEK